MKKTILWLHRYLSLFLMPLFMLIIITGGILAFKPILEPTSGVGFSSTLTAESINVALEKIDATTKITALTVLEDGRSVLVTDDKRAVHVYDLSTGEERFDNLGMSGALYSTAKQLHKDLYMGTGIIIELASYIMLFVLVVGPILLWPRPKASLIDVHNIVGWILYPVMVIVSLTGVLMIFHVGAPDFNKLNPADERPVVEVVQTLTQAGSLNNLVSISKVRGRYQLITLNENDQRNLYQMDDEGRLKPKDFGRYWAKELHEGTWGGALSGWINFIATGALFVLSGTGCYSWLRRKIEGSKKEVVEGARFLVTFASQTGTASQLARKTAEALRKAGEKVACNPMSTISVDELSDYETVLFFISTTGVGEVPEQGKKLLAELKDKPLSNNIAIFALGDRSYAAQNFCGAGKALHALLEKTEASFIMPTEYVDGSPGELWTLWLEKLASITQLTLEAGEPLAIDQKCSLTLMEKNRLDLPEANLRETWCLRFCAEDDIAYQAGDLLMITPPNEIKSRAYSIGSSSIIEKYIEITVGLETFRDEQGAIMGHGVCSSYLCHTLEKGDVIDVQLRKNADFNPPSQPDQKEILVATGTGIAPFLGFVSNQAKHSPLENTWLFYGASKQQGDYLHGEAFEAYAQKGVLKLTTAFSLDADDGLFIQDKMVQNAKEIYQWITVDRAIIYVCGRANTVGEGVTNALIAIYRQLVNDDIKAAMTWIADLQKQQQIRMDLFG